MFKARHVLRQVTVQEERDFERANVDAKRSRYLQTNPLDRFDNDPPYALKVSYVKNSLGPVRGLILDIGGNTAGEATILQQQGYHFVVGDINEVALNLSRERVEKFGLKQPHYIALDVHNLPFEDDSFSAVTVIEALHHFVDYDQALREIRRVLKPGGQLVSLEPNALDPLRRASEIRDRLRGTIEKSFRVGQLKVLCERNGFAEIRVRTVPTGRSNWKLREVPAYRRPIARCHGWLSETCPALFGSLLLQARKQGLLQDSEPAADQFQQILRSPLSRSKINYDRDKRLWMECDGKRGFPDLNGIPVLIAEDAVRPSP
jgi:SAM-dependent methyltransferase